MCDENVIEKFTRLKSRHVQFIFRKASSLAVANHRFILSDDRIFMSYKYFLMLLVFP